MMVWEFVAWGYLAGVALVLLRQLAFALIQLDEFDWEYLNKAEFYAFLVMAAVFWPLICFKKPKILLNPSFSFETELNNAKESRFRSNLERRPPYCSGQVALRHTPNAGVDAKTCSFNFSAEDVEMVLREGGRFGSFGWRDHGALYRWVELAVHCDPAETEVPSIWQMSFNIVADELIHQGLGQCLCAQCGQMYRNKVLVPSTGSTGFGWLQNRYSCPEGHLVMSYDFIKVFCDRKYGR